jgi:alkylation response protein AidB-like acyl-CoA dehydrogenase
VDFTFDEDQNALRDVARQALEREFTGDVVRALADDPQGVGPWQSFVDLGWTGLLVPESHGGAGAGFLETCIVLEQMGRIPTPGPFFSSAIFATLAARALGADSLLPDLAGGGRRGTVALHEIGAGDPLTTVRARGRRKGAGWEITGVKPLVLDGHTADWLFVVARTEEGIRTFLLDPSHATIEPVPTLDPTRKAARVEFDGAPVEPVGPAGNQGPIWRRILDDVAVGLASELVGVADRALEEAIGYTGRRIAFDRPIATFQVVRHRIVDMFHSLEMARVGAQYAAWTSDTDAEDRVRAAAMAAAYASETAVRVTGDNIQVHGGVGFTWADDAHFLFKRAKQNEVLIGGAAHERRRLAGMLLEPVG